MGVTKQYLRFVASSVFGIVGSSKVVVIPSDDASFRVAVAACEHVFLWDMKLSEKEACLRGGASQAEVSALAARPDGAQLAVGYTDGVVRLFDLQTAESTVVFSGHKSAVTALNYDANGMRLVSGSKDNQVILWDLVTEAGLYRLKGHKGVITQARFLSKHNILVTSSKDTLVKFWDLDTQHCFKTLTAHRTEVWDFVLLNDETTLLSGCTEMNLFVWSLDFKQQVDVDGNPTAKRRYVEAVGPVKTEDEEDDALLSCHLLGYIRRHGRGRVAGIIVECEGRLVACHGTDSSLELFKIHTEDEICKSVKKKERKNTRKRKRNTEDEATPQDVVVVSADDKVKRIGSVKLSGKIKSLSFCSTATKQVKLLALLANNRLVVHDVSPTTVPPAISDDPLSLDHFGHRTVVRTTAFSSDSTAILSASGETLKVWNRSSLHCICTVACDLALASVFAPGDRHVIIGTKSGHLQLFDLASAALIEDIPAHDAAVWSLCLSPDKRSVVSGSADKNVKFWDFELVTDKDYSLTRKRLSLEHTRTLKMEEDVLSVRFSPDNRLLAVALLDCTVKVFFADTLKFFLSLYGHKLPVLSIDISHDSSLLASASADKNIKLWGLDFGDCHRSIFAHDDSIMCVQFVPRTHLLFTCSKDGRLKQWDADTFENVLTLKGHQSQVWSLAVSPNGNHVVSSSHDKTLRLWQKTDEVLVLDDEKEMEREKEYEEAAVADDKGRTGDGNEETGLPSQRTVETVKAAERLMEAIELYGEENEKLTQHKRDCQSAGKQLAVPALHPMLQAYSAATPQRYVLEVMKRIKSSELDESLLVLPFTVVLKLLPLLNGFIENNWHVELSMRAILFLLRIHQSQITSNHALLSVISKLRSSTKQRVSEMRDCVGFNLAALRHIQHHMADSEKTIFFSDATQRFKQKKRKQKKRAILTVAS